MKPTTNSRFVHWVLKVGNLKESLHFYESVLGLRVLRHEEFTEGCEATCNGPYAGAWSKTMIGYGPERENFALELTYNYGIDGYKSGDDLQYIAISCPAALERAKHFGYQVTDDIIESPDKYKFKILPSIKGRGERFNRVAIRVSKLDDSEKYWSGLLGLNKNSETSNPPSSILSFGDGQVSLELIEVSVTHEPIDHGLSSGRAAFACKTPSVNDIYTMVKDEKLGSVMTPPLTLPTPGKADVVVTILADPDDYEICFVEDEAFYDLATPKYDVVDWAYRTERGGDGAPPPKSKLEHGPTMKALTSRDDLKSLCDTDTNKAILLEFGAGWCRNCKKLGPTLEQLATENAGRLIVCAVDVEEAEDLADEYVVSAVPHIVLLKFEEKSWIKAEEMIGPNKDQLMNTITTALK